MLAGDGIAWRQLLELAIRDLEDEPSAGGWNLAAAFLDLDALTSVRRKEYPDARYSGQLGLEDLVELFGASAEHQVSIVESGRADRSVFSVVVEQTYPLNALLAHRSTASNDQLGQVVIVKLQPREDFVAAKLFVAKLTSTRPRTDAGLDRKSIDDLARVVVDPKSSLAGRCLEEAAQLHVVILFVVVADLHGLFPFVGTIGITSAR
jgi:hypothetical protein